MPDRHDEAARQEFLRGYLIACCNLVNLHDAPEIAHDVLSQLGITKREARAMDLCEYDLRALRKIENARGSTSPYRTPRAGKGAPDA